MPWSRSKVNSSDRCNAERSTIEPVTREIKQVSDIIGEWGLWQANIAIFFTSVAIFSAFNGLSSNFYQPRAEFACIDTNWVSNGQSDPIADECKAPNGVECTSWSYYNSAVNKTAVTEFNWICSNSWIGSFSATVYMAGIMAAGFISGIASDSFGRKKVILVAFVIEILSGLLCAFAPNTIVFLIARGLLGFGSYGRNITGFLIAVETTANKHRAKIGVAVQLGWATGAILLPPIAYYTQNFRHILLITTLPEILWFAWMIWFIPESPRWLINKGKFDQAKKVIMNAVKLNGKSLDGIDEAIESLKLNLASENESIPGNDSVFSDLWKSNILILYTLVFYLNWFTNAFVYYGISLNVGDLGQDLFWSSFWSGLVEVPAYLFCILIFKYVGRRTLLVVTMLVLGFSCLAIVPFYIWIPRNELLIKIFAFTGKFAVTCSFAIIYVHSAEVYPTVLRQIGVGSCSVVARIGSFMSPFMKELADSTNLGVTMAVYGVISLISGLAAIKLPETKGKDMPDSLKDLEKFNSKK